MVSPEVIYMQITLYGTKQVVSMYLGIYIIVYIIKETMNLRESVIPTNRLSARDRIMV